MIAALLLVQAATVAPPPQAPAPSMPPQDWSALPVFPAPRGAQVMDGAGFVRAEIDSGRCKAGPPQPDGARVVAPVAILIGQDGAVTRIVPRAIGCVTVEQYTVGYVQSLVRGGPGAVIPAPGWYRLAVTYRW